jgi:hypothetical protein
MRLVSSVASVVVFACLIGDLHSGVARAASRAFHIVTPPNHFVMPPNSRFIPNRQVVRRAFPFARIDRFRFGPGYGGTWYGGTLVPAGPGIYGQGGFGGTWYGGTLVPAGPGIYGAGGSGGIGSGPDAPYTGSAIYYPLQIKRPKHKSSLALPQVVYGIHPASTSFPSAQVIDSNLP